MRIAIYHNLPSGGAKRALYEEMKRMAGRHTLDVYTLSTANHEFGDIRPFADRHRIYPFAPRPVLNSPFGRLNPAIRLQNLRRLQGLERQVAADIDAGGYDVVFVHPCQVENSPSVLRFVQKTPAVYYCQEPLRILYESMPWRPYDKAESPRRKALNRFDPLPGLFRRTIQRNDRANLLQARRVLVNSEFVRQTVLEIYGVEAQVSYLGVDADLFRPLGDERERFVLSVGSLTPLKGFDFLIESLATLSERDRLPLVIASNFQNPPERDYLTELAHRKGVDLELTGNVTDERLVALYNAAAVTVYAPVREPFGFVSIESMACETPVVAVREGGLQETVLPDRTGKLVERVPARFGEALCELLASPARAAAFGKAGRSHVIENWTWDRSVMTLEKHLGG